MKKVVLSCIVALGLFGGAVAQAETATPSCLPNVPWFPVFPWCPPCPTTPTTPETPTEPETPVEPDTIEKLVFSGDYSIQKEDLLYGGEEYKYSVSKRVDFNFSKSWDLSTFANVIKITNNSNEKFNAVVNTKHQIRESFLGSSTTISPGETLIIDCPATTEVLKDEQKFSDLSTNLDSGNDGIYEYWFLFNKYQIESLEGFEEINIHVEFYQDLSK